MGDPFCVDFPSRNPCRAKWYERSLIEMYEMHWRTIE